MNEDVALTTELASVLEAWGGEWLNRPGLIVTVLLVTLAIDMVQRFAFGWLRRRASDTEQVWDDAMAGAGGTPIATTRSAMRWSADS